MPFTPLVTAGIETALNTFLWRDKALKPARQRLLGKVLRVQLQDFATPVGRVSMDMLAVVTGTVAVSVSPRWRYRLPGLQRCAIW